MDIGQDPGADPGAQRQPGKLIALAERQASSSLDCERCRILAGKFGREPDCEECVGDAVLAPENYEVYALIVKYGPTFFGDMGGIDLPAIAGALELEGVQMEERTLMAQWIIAYCAAFRRAKKEKDG